MSPAFRAAILVKASAHIKHQLRSFCRNSLELMAAARLRYSSTVATTYSLVTTCAKRWDFLERSLPSWLAMPGRGNIFIVTYAFDTIPVQGLEQAHVIVVKGEQRFHRTRALNLGALVARQIDDPQYLMFTDADIIVRDAGSFLTGISSGEAPAYVLDSRYALGAARQGLPREHDPEQRKRGIRGTHLVQSSLFFRINGFNQQLQGWGYDDFDLYQRYRLQSSKVTFYDRAALFHQPHNDKQRGELQDEGIRDSMIRNGEQSRRNPDPLGSSWAAQLGYPDYEVRPPTAPKV